MHRFLLSNATSLLRIHRRLVYGLLAVGLAITTAGLAAEEPATAPGPAASPEAIEFFESRIRPLLIQRCGECHLGEESSGGLLLHQRSDLLKGGDSGPAIVPGDAETSLLIRAVRRMDEDLVMPPEQKLSPQEVQALEQWVKQGAPWPDTTKLETQDRIADWRDHWAFQPVERPELPAVRQPAGDWVRNEIDQFIAARLAQEALQPSPAADRRTLIRRASYTITGLPPSPRQVEQFINDPDPNAYERLIDRLLDSPQYGEQWARHWLDVARYSDTKGYVYAREERFWTHAWSYRDWVVDAFNRDLPYDQFLRLQIAADQVDDRRPEDLAAMGYLTLGRRFLGVRRDIIDDQIDVVCRGTMALTVSCARCHDHKYDPIPTADYYSLYGVFDSCVERMARLSPPGDAAEAFEQGLAERQKKLNDRLAESLAEGSKRARERAADYLFAQTELHKYPANGFDQIFAKSDLLPAIVRRWQAYLRKAQREADPVFTAWHAYLAIADEPDFDQRAVQVTRDLQADPQRMHPAIAEAFEQPPSSMLEVAERYGAVFRQVDQRWQELVAQAQQTGSPEPGQLPDEADEALRRVLYGPQAPAQIPHEPIVRTETFFDSGTCTELWKLQGEVDRWIIQNGKVAYAMTLADRETVSDPRIFRRGDPLRLGKDVPRQFLSLFGDEQQPFQTGSGRRELAEAIVDPANPLTARVIVNRVWQHHFGQGLVSTASDFGTRAAPPSHPELLDWLADQLVQEGWSLKKLQRRILLSAAYRQSSLGPKDAAMLEKCIAVDPENRLLWRMNPHRLSFEELRDSMLAAAGSLDLEMGGKPADLFKEPYATRRTLYGLVDRQFLPTTLRMFDFANPDLHVPERSETTVPQQSLFFLNHPLVLEQARALAGRSADAPTPEQRVTRLFQFALQRPPTSTELQEALGLLAEATAPETPATRPTAADWQYGYGAYDEVQKQVTGFQKLPHFTGMAWQGGSAWPDAALGWVQLTATGGHPGNDRQHASVRRWTAPRDMTVAIKSTLTHEPAAGDGIRAFIVDSRSGTLASAVIHQDSKKLNVEQVSLQAGDTLDFLVDIKDVLNSDQYLWTVEIREASEADSSEATVWNSEADFPADTTTPLSGWEQLAHLLLCTNEFSFFD